MPKKGDIIGRAGDPERPHIGFEIDATRFIEQMDRMEAEAKRLQAEMSRNPYELVREFQEKFDHRIGDEPNNLDDDEDFQKMRLALIQEEFIELLEACGYDDAANEIEDVVLRKTGEADVVAMADALGDLEYVVNGMALSAGIDLPAVVKEIHRSNMSKLGADGKPIYREDGKILKGPKYEEPDLPEVLGL